MLVNKLGVDVLLLMLYRLRFSKSFQSDNKHLLVFLAPNIIFIGQLEKDIGRRASGVQYLSPADQ